MEAHIIKAKSLANEGKINWASPLIDKLEEQLKHSAIEWVIKVVKEIIQEFKPINQNNYFSWLVELEEVVEKKHFSDIQYLEKRCRLIFSPPEGRNIYSILISRLFGAEGYYRLEKYELYTRLLWDILARCPLQQSDE